jgi:hypothetical protein
VGEPARRSTADDLAALQRRVEADGEPAATRAEDEARVALATAAERAGAGSVDEALAELDRARGLLDAHAPPGASSPRPDEGSTRRHG